MKQRTLWKLLCGTLVIALILSLTILDGKIILTLFGLHGMVLGSAGIAFYLILTLQNNRSVKKDE